MLTFSAKAKYQTVSRSAYSNQSSVEKTIINAIVTLWIEAPTILKLNTIFFLIVTEISMYLRYFYCCIGNRYSVFYENYIISQLTVRKKKISHIFCCVSSDNESHSSRQPKTTEIWWEVRRIKFAFSWCAKINNSYRFRKPWSKLKILPTYQKILDNENSLAQFFRDMVGEE